MECGGRHIGEELEAKVDLVLIAFLYHGEASLSSVNDLIRRILGALEFDEVEVSVLAEVDDLTLLLVLALEDILKLCFISSFFLGLDSRLSGVRVSQGGFVLVIGEGLGS
jgi:hypothetical protein